MEVPAPIYKLYNVRFKGIPHLPKAAEIQVQYLQMSNEQHPGCLGCFGGLYYPHLSPIIFGITINHYEDPY